jgi:hypothetical protein
MSFRSYFWGDAPLPPPLERALQVVLDPAAGDQRWSALLVLLNSESPVARGVGLDQFTMFSGQSRQGTLRPGEVVRASARAAALRELATAPLESRAAGEVAMKGPNHASAFYALWHVGDPQDAPVLARALAVNDNPAVLEIGIRAAGSAIREQPSPDRSLLALLTTFASDQARSAEVRSAALAALAESPSPESALSLLAGLDDLNLEISAASAELLLERDRDRYLQRVSDRVARWPSDVRSARADVVRDLLESNE